ncbi:hypothetical protein PtB15_16B195 [Puccinia triticina]|nr:hypothetical protein PtB15_16B195 [Puccinia triticina]
MQSFGLTNPALVASSNPDEDHHHHHHHHHHQHAYHQHHQSQSQQNYQYPFGQPDLNCSSNPNQLPLDPPPPLLGYEFQVPINLFSNQPLPSFSPGSASSCRSSSSSNHSLFNSHQQHQQLSANHPHSPPPLHASYLTNSLELTQTVSSKGLDRSSLLGCHSRDSRSGSVSSEPNSNWQVPQAFDIPTDSFELLRWGGGEESHWELPRFGDDRGHERSRSEGDIVPSSRFQPAVDQSLEPTFDLSGTGTCDFTAAGHGNQTEVNEPGRRKNVARMGWPGEDQEAEEENDRFDPTRSKFVLDTLPSTDHKINNGLQPICSVTTEGPVLASFALPPDNNQHDVRMLSTDDEPLSTARASDFKTTTTGSKTAKPASNKKTPNRNPRVGNNGGRCRRLAPANRECPHCGAKFTRNDRLNYHIDSIHEHKEPKFKCDIGNCSRAFRQRSDLVRHSRHVHHKI